MFNTTIIFGSKNPAKVEACNEILLNKFDRTGIIFIEAESRVSPTPFGHNECKQGARNRVDSIQKIQPFANFWIGAEGGVVKENGVWKIGGWVLIKNKYGKEVFGCSRFVELPDHVVKVLEPSKRLSEVVDYSKFPEDLVTRKDELGINGLVTRGKYTRVTEFKDALQNAWREIY